MSQAGIGTVAVVAAAAAVMGGAVGTPVAVDEMDVNPTHPLYGLERAGERIKEATYAGGVDWNLQRAEERTNEYQHVVNNTVTHNHINLLEEAGNRIMKAAKGAGNSKALQRVQKALKQHENTLENVRKRVADSAKPAISLALSRSTRVRAVVKEFDTGDIPSLGKGAQKKLSKKLNQVKNEVQNLEQQVRESRDKGKSPAQIASNINMETANDLMNKFTEKAEQGEAEKYVAFAQEAQEFTETAASLSQDNQGLQRAIEASRKHIRVLQRVQENLPEQAQQSIQRNIERARQGVNTLENVASRIGKGVPPGKAGEAFENIQKRMGPPENVGPPENAGPPENTGPPENIGPPENAGPPKNAGRPKSFVHNRGKLPDWVPGPPPWAGPGGKIRRNSPVPFRTRVRKRPGETRKSPKNGIRASRQGSEYRTRPLPTPSTPVADGK